MNAIEEGQAIAMALVSIAKIILAAGIAAAITGTVTIPATTENALIIAALGAIYKYAEQKGWLASIPHPTVMP